MPFTLLNSGVTRPTFTKRLHNVARLSQINPLKSELRYSTFKNAKATNKGESADFTYLTLKLIAMATSLERIEKEGQIGNKMSIIW